MSNVSEMFEYDIDIAVRVMIFRQSCLVDRNSMTTVGQINDVACCELYLNVFMCGVYGVWSGILVFTVISL